MWRAQVAAEYHALDVGALAELQLDVGRTQHMPRRLQAYLARAAVGFVEGEPVIVGQGDDALLDDLEVALQLVLVTADGEPEGILQYDRQQPGGRFAAQDRPVEARCQQVRDTPDMVDVHVRHDQRLDTLDGEIQRQLIFVPRFVVALKLPAVDQYAAVFVHPQLMTRAGHAFASAVVDEFWMLHRVSLTWTDRARQKSAMPVFADARLGNWPSRIVSAA